jgi:hypothetical protein
MDVEEDACALWENAANETPGKPGPMRRFLCAGIAGIAGVKVQVLKCRYCRCQSAGIAGVKVQVLQV